MLGRKKINLYEALIETLEVTREEAPNLPGFGYHAKEVAKGIGKFLISRYALPVVTALGVGLGTYILTPSEIKQGNFEVGSYKLLKFSDKSGEYIFAEVDGKILAKKLPKKEAFTLPGRKLDSKGNLENTIDEILVHGESFELVSVTGTASTEPLRIKRK